MRILLTLALVAATCISYGQTSEKIAGLPDTLPASAKTFSIQAEFYDGRTVSFSQGKAYLKKIFPQLSDLKMVRSGGDIIIRILADKPLELSDARKSEEYETERIKYESISPLAVHVPANTIGYFQPLTLKLELAGRTVFSLRTIGDYFKLQLGSNKSNDDIPTGFGIPAYFPRSHKPDRDVELKNLLMNLHFIEVHIDKLK